MEVSDFNEALDDGVNRLQLKPKMQPKRAVPCSTTKALFRTDFGVLREHEMNSIHTGLVSKKSSSRQYAAPTMMQHPRSSAPLRVLRAKDVYNAKHQGDMNVFALRPIRPVQHDYKCLSQYTGVMPGPKHPDIAARIIRLEQQCKDFNMFQHHYRMGML